MLQWMWGCLYLFELVRVFGFFFLDVHIRVKLLSHIEILLLVCWETFRLFSHVSSDAQTCLTLCDLIYCRTLGLPVHHQLLELTQTHVHWVSDATQPYHALSSPSSPAFNLSQHQGLFKWVSSSHQGAKVLEFQLQHQSFQWTLRTDLL